MARTIDHLCWIGLGKLGLPMAARIAGAGIAVTGYDVSAERRDLASGRGVAIARSAEDAVQAAGVVFTSLPDDGVLLALLGSAGSLVAGSLVARLAPGSVVVDTSTVSPDASASVGAALAAAGMTYLRAPVSGNPVLAEAGTLTSLVSGPRSTYEQVMPAFNCYSKTAIWLGENEQARYAKLAINLMIAVSAGMMAEALALAAKGGIDPSAMLDLMGESAVGSPMVKYKIPPLKLNDYTSTFSCRQMAKDLDLVLGACRQTATPAPLGAMMREIYSTLVATGEGDADFIATVRLTRRLAGIEI